MKKILAIIMTAILMMAGFAACGAQEEQAPETSDSSTEKLSVITTIFPVYDWTRTIIGDSEAADIDMLIDTGVDLHSFQPSAEDISKIAACDVFVYVGGESDKWVEDALEEATNDNMVVVDLMDVLGDRAKEEELVEGMEAGEHEHEHEHEDGDTEEHEHEDGDAEEHEHEHEEGHEYDEHIWLSLKNASILCDAISTALGEADEANSETYSANADAYISQLDNLDKEYEKATSEAAVKTLLFGDRFPFRYMTDDYGLDYYAAFIGCSAETEASFETIAFLSSKMDELGLTKVMTIEGSDHKIAESIINNTKTKDQEILTLDSMQSTTAEDAEAGASYMSIMESNLEVLKKALS